MKNSLFIILILTLSSAGFSQSGELTLPVPKDYLISKTTTPIQVDGIAEDTWVQAPWTDLFTDIEADKKLAPFYDTRVKMLWDEDYLYFFAEMEEEHVWGDITERDAVIFYNNDFEIFIKPNDRNPVYAEFEVNALGTLWELLLYRPYRRNGPVFDEWDVNGTLIGIDIKGTLNDPSDTDEGWNLEMAIPLDALKALDRGSKVESGSVWRINFSRVQWDHQIDNGIYSKKTDENGNRLPEYNWVWSPQYAIDMHRPEHWGYLYFTDQPSEEVELSMITTEYQYLFYLYRSRLNNIDFPSSGDHLVNKRMLSYEITNTNLGFEITVKNRNGLSLTVNQDGYLN